MRLPRLTALDKRFRGKSDSALATEIARLLGEERSLQRTERLFRDRAHSSVDGTAAKAELGAFLAKHSTLQSPLKVGGPQGADPLAVRLGELVTLAQWNPEEWPAAVDSADAFSSMSLLEFEAELARLRSEARELGLELERRERDRRIREEQAALGELEQKVSAR